MAERVGTKRQLEHTEVTTPVSPEHVMDFDTSTSFIPESSEMAPLTALLPFSVEDHIICSTSSRFFFSSVYISVHGGYQKKKKKN